MSKNESKPKKEEFRFEFSNLPPIPNKKIIEYLDLCSLYRFSAVCQYTKYRVDKSHFAKKWRDCFEKQFPLISVSYTLDIPSAAWQVEYQKWAVSTFEGIKLPKYSFFLNIPNIKYFSKEDISINEQNDVEVNVIYSYLKKRVFFDHNWINLQNYISLVSPKKIATTNTLLSLLTPKTKGCLLLLHCIWEIFQISVITPQKVRPIYHNL